MLSEAHDLASAYPLVYCQAHESLILPCATCSHMARSTVHAGNGDGVDAVLQSNVEDDLAAMGFGTPVTKEQAGRRYHKELARQVRA